MSRIQNPSSTDKKSEIQYLGFGIFSVEFRIQDCLGLLYMKQFTKTPRFDDNQAKFIMNEIQPFKSLKVVPCELSCKNMISWHMKVTCYFQMWKDHRCYGYIINRAFRSKKIIKWNILAFIGVYIKNRTLHGCLEIRNFSSCVENKWNNYFSIREEKFCISAHPCNILHKSLKPEKRVPEPPSKGHCREYPPPLQFRLP